MLNDRKGRGLLQNEATYEAELIKSAEYLNTKYTKDRFVNIVKVRKVINQI